MDCCCLICFVGELYKVHFVKTVYLSKLPTTIPEECDQFKGLDKHIHIQYENVQVVLIHLKQ